MGQAWEKAGPAPALLRARKVRRGALHFPARSPVRHAHARRHRRYLATDGAVRFPCVPCRLRASGRMECGCRRCRIGAGLRWLSAIPCAQRHPLRSAPSPARAPVERGKCRRHRIGGDVVLPHGQERPGKMGRARKRSRAPRGLQNARPGERLGGAGRGSQRSVRRRRHSRVARGRTCCWRGGGARHPRSRWQMRSRRARVPGTAAGAPRRWPGERAPSGWLVERGRAQGNPSSASEEDAHVGGQTSARPVLTARGAAAEAWGRLCGRTGVVEGPGEGLRPAGRRGRDRGRLLDAATHAWRFRLQGLGRVPRRAGGGAREQPGPTCCLLLWGSTAASMSQNVPSATY